MRTEGRLHTKGLVRDIIDPMENLESASRIEDLDAALVDERLDVVDGYVLCLVCGLVVTPVAAVGVAAMRIRGHIEGHEI